MGLACTAGEGVLALLAEVLAGVGDAGRVVSVRRNASTRSWKGSVRLMLVPIGVGPVFCYEIPRRLRITERQFYSGTSRGAGSAGKSDMETGSDEWIRSRGVETSR